MTPADTILVSVHLTGAHDGSEVRVYSYGAGVTVTSATVQRQRPPVGQTSAPGLPPLLVVVDDVEAP